MLANASGKLAEQGMERFPSQGADLRLEQREHEETLHGQLDDLGFRVIRTRALRPSDLYRHYSGSLTHCQPRVSWYTARTRKGPAASDSSAMTRTIWR